MGETDFASAATLRELGDRMVAFLSHKTAFDRLNIGLIDREAYEFIDVYVYGQNVAGRETGHRRTLTGTVVEAAIAAGDGTWAGGDEETLLSRFPRFGPVLESGIRAMLAVPLRRDDRVVAALVLASSDPDAFDDEVLQLARWVGEAASLRIVDLTG